MGEAASVVKAFSCESCAKFVCNAMHCHSKCMRDCCEIDVETEKVDIPPDDHSELSIHVDGCCEIHDK